MHRRTTYLLFGVLILLLIAWASNTLVRQQAARPLQRTLLSQPASLNTIDRLQITRPGEELVLQRSGERWLISGTPAVPADALTVEHLLGALRSATITATAARTQDDLTQFGLDPKQRVVVRGSAGQTIVVEVMIGRATEDQLSSFTTTLGDPAIYLAEGIAPPDIRRDFRDFSALRFDAAQATSVAISQPRAGYALAKVASGQWQLDGRAADQTAVADLLRTLSAVRAQDFPSNTATFTPSGVSIEVVTASSTFALTFGQPTREGGVIVKNHNGYVYLLSPSTRESLTPLRRTLLP